LPSRALTRRIIVGISGASGTVYGVRLLEALRALDFESHLVMTRSARLAMAYETALKPADVHALAAVTHRNEDTGAAIASGSFRTLGMVVAPCSIRSLSEIATGVTSSLLTRAADVVLKERRRLVLLVRETPLHLGHLRSMTQVTEMGAIVMPPVPALYQRPRTIDDIVGHTIGRVLDLFDIDNSLVQRWGEPVASPVEPASPAEAGQLSNVTAARARQPRNGRRSS
jgi:flavin prenyltransferase